MAGCHVPVPWQGGLTPTFGSLAQFRSGVWRHSIREFGCKINYSPRILLHSSCIIILF